MDRSVKYRNPYQAICQGKGRWLKANFHTHAGTGKGTCGAYDIAEVFSLYEEAGYDVLALSNHDMYTAVGEFQAGSGLTLLNGFEYSRDPHMLCIDNKGVISGAHQDVIDECRRQGGFVILCHPNWQRKEYWPWQQMEQLEGYTGIEICNGVIFRLNGSGLATDAWDYLLSRGKRVWGFGNDDFHRWYDLKRVWNVIYSPSENAGDICEAIQNGCFYVSTGLVLDEFVCEGDVLRVVANAADSYVDENVYRFIGKDGRVLRVQQGKCGEYALSGEEPYVRVHVVSEHGAMLWTQPVFSLRGMWSELYPADRA